MLLFCLISLSKTSIGWWEYVLLCMCNSSQGNSCKQQNLERNASLIRTSLSSLLFYSTTFKTFSKPLCKFVWNLQKWIMSFIAPSFDQQVWGDPSSTGVSAVGECSLQIFCISWFCHNHVSLQLSVWFQQISAVCWGEVFAVVLRELGIRTYSLSAEHSMTRKPLTRGTFVLPMYCFKRTDL